MAISPPVLTLPDAPTQALSIRAKALLFHDPGSLLLLQQIERIARSDATALIVGETGTGKELVARHIHQTSGRTGPFIAVNCGAFTESLIDAELFGHEAGAYTGASGARAGWFEAAQGGTLFLDEIGDLSPSLQVKLLRVLQERQVVRIGSRRAIALDVRLVAATNIDLQRAVEAQHFRADLFYRLSVAPLLLPPLRERRGDILPLARHFLGLFARRMALREPVSLSDEAQAALLAYAWPGNIRELENVIHFALIVCKDPVVQATDLKLVTTPPGPATTPPGDDAFAGDAALPLLDPASRRPGHPGTRAPLPGPVSAADREALFDTLGATLLRLAQLREPHLFHLVEATLVHTVYAHCRDNQVQSARVMGVTRNTLRTLLKRHGLLAAQETGEMALEGGGVG